MGGYYRDDVIACAGGHGHKFVDDTLGVAKSVLSLGEMLNKTFLPVDDAK